MNLRAAGAAAAVAAGAAVLYSRRRARGGAAGVVGLRLRTWLPAAPASRVTRAAAIVWAAPVSVVGMVVGGAGAVRPRITHGVVLFAPARGISGPIIRRRGYTAMALGHVVVAVEEPAPALLVHELLHVRQAERLGPLFLPTYLVLLAVHGYRGHPLEQAARLAAAGGKEIV